MRSPKSVVGRMADAPLIGTATFRRVVLIVLLAICALLSLFPERYRAAMSLTPADPSSLGLGGAVGQLGALNSVFGNQSAVEVSIKIAGSPGTDEKVVERLRLDQRLGKSKIKTERWLDDRVEIRAIRGGIIQFEIKLRDPDLGRDIVAAYGDVVREQLGVIARRQTAYKRKILADLVEQSNDRLARAQMAYNSFRLRTRYSSPAAAIAAVGDRIPTLEAAIKSKQVDLNTQRQFATDDNMQVRQILAEIEALRIQLAEVRSTSPIDPSSVGRVVKEDTEVERLRRDLDTAQGLYDNYKRFLQGTSVEDLTSTANVRILEPPYIDPERQVNMVPLLAGIIILLLGLAIEFYNLRPPVRRESLA